jgi:hypothetical protein
VIHYLTTAPWSFTIDRYLQACDPAMATRIRVHHLESLTPEFEAPTGTWIFTGIEQFGPAGRDAAMMLANALDDSPGVTVCNHPARALQRGPLLRSLHAHGINRFTAVPVTAPLDALRYPVFLRRESRHDGAISPLLRGPRALDDAIARAVLIGHPVGDLLAVEFLDTSVGGIHTKYAAFVVGDRVLARHVMRSHDWMVKSSSAELTVSTARAELSFVADSPHADQLAAVAALAGVQFGRIDYGVLDGRVQVWEINLNPTFARDPNMLPATVSPDVVSLRTERNTLFFSRLREAFERLDAAPASQAPVPVRLPRDLLAAARNEQRSAQRLPPAGPQLPRPVRSALEPLVSLALPLVGRLARRRG